MSKKNNSIEKYISKAIAELPEESLKQIAQTQEQLDYWSYLRDWNALVAMQWKAFFTGQNNPLNSFIENGEIDRWTYDMVGLTVDAYTKLWALIQEGEPFIRQRVPPEDYPFRNAAGLFLAIVRPNLNEQFRLSLGYSRISLPNKGKVRELFAKAIEQDLNAKEERKFVELHHEQPLEVNPWLVVSMITFAQKAKNNRLLGNKLDDFWRAKARLAQEESAACKARRASKFRPKLRSYRWNQGDIAFGNQGGTYT